MAGAAELDGGVTLLLSGTLEAGAAELLVSGVLDVAGAAELAAADCELVSELLVEEEALLGFWQVSEIERTLLTL